MKLSAMRFLVATTALALVAAACGSGTSTTAPVATAVQTKGPVATTAPAATNTPAATPLPAAPTGEMVVAFSNMGAFEMLMVTGTARNYMDALYDYAIYADLNGNLDPKSGLVSSWEMSPDASTWTFKTRNDVFFHNGDRATAKDIQSTITRSAAPTSKRAAASILRRDVVSMDVPDEGTLIVKLSGTNIFWGPTNLSSVGTGGAPSYVEPKNYIEAKGEEFANRNPVGTGVYKFKSLVLDDRLNMEAVDKHWLLGVPRTKSLVYRLIPEETTSLALLKSGELNLMQISRNGSLDAGKTKTLRIVERKDSGYATFIGVYDQFLKEYPGYGPNPLASTAVRQALFWYGVDRASLVKNFLGGYGTAAMEPNAWDPAYQRRPVTQYDQAKAKQMIADAGFSKGFELDLLIVPRPALPEGQQVMEAIATWWEGLGVKVNRKPTQYETVTSIQVKKAQAASFFDKPTISGMFFLANSGIPSLTTAAPCTTPWANSDSVRDSDQQRCTIQKTNLGPKSVDDYIKGKKVYDGYDVAQAHNSTFFQLGELFAGDAKVPAGWAVGKEPYGWRFERAAAMR